MVINRGPKHQHPLYYKQCSYYGFPMWFPLLRIVARLARLAAFMVGGGLLRIVARLDNRAHGVRRGRAGFLVMSSGWLQCSHSVAPYHGILQRRHSVDASGTVTPSAIVAGSWDVCFGGRNRSRQFPRFSTMADLSRFLLIDSVSGTVLCASQCFLVDDDSLSLQQWEEMENMTDSEVGLLAINHGRKLSDVVTLKVKLPGEN